MAEDRYRMAATGILGRMLAGLSMTAVPMPREGDLLLREKGEEPDFSAAAIEPCGEYGVRMVLVMPSGDRYEVVVDWVGDDEGTHAR